MEIDLSIIVETYMLFTNFEIVIPQNDYEQINSLKFDFDNMIAHAKQVSDQIAEMQNPLLIELTDGIATFQSEIDTFNFDFDNKGPMTDGLSAKEASDRVNIKSISQIK